MITNSPHTRHKWDLTTPESMLAVEVLQDCIDKHLRQMPDAQRQVVILSNVPGVSFADICCQLNLSASNVRVLLHRGRMRLMEMVDRFEATGCC